MGHAVRRLARPVLGHGAQQRHSLLNFWHGKATVQLLAVASRAHHPSRFQYSEMLGEVSFGNAESRLQFCGPAIAALQHRDQLQPRWIGEGLADGSFALVIVLIRFGLFLHHTAADAPIRCWRDAMNLEIALR